LTIIIASWLLSVFKYYILGIPLHFFMAPISKFYSMIGIWDNRNVSSYYLSSEIQEDSVLVNPPSMKLEHFSVLTKFGVKNYGNGCFILIPFTLLDVLC